MKKYRLCKIFLRKLNANITEIELRKQDFQENKDLFIKNSRLKVD